MNELERAMLEFIANGEKPEDFPRVIEARNRALGEKSEYIEKPIIEEVVGETAEPQEKPIKDMTSEIISREKYLEIATLLSAGGKLEDMGKITELHNKYFEGLESTIINMKELDSLKKGIESVEIRKPEVSPTKTRLDGELRIAEEKLKSLEDYDKKLEEISKKSEEERQKEEEIKLKIKEIENRIKELREKLKVGGLSEEELKNIDEEIRDLFRQLEDFKRELLELVNLLMKDMEKEAERTYGVRSPEELKTIHDEDRERAKRVLTGTPEKSDSSRPTMPSDTHREERGASVGMRRSTKSNRRFITRRRSFNTSNAFISTFTFIRNNVSVRKSRVIFITYKKRKKGRYSYN